MTDFRIHTTFFAGLLCIIFSVTTLCYVMRFIAKLYELSKYTVPIKVKCTDVTEIQTCVNQHRNVEVMGLPKTRRDRIWYTVNRPSYSGWINNKCYTFCRKKDVNQPRFPTIGGETRIYIKPGAIQCWDFIEQQEKNDIKTKMFKKICLYFVLATIAGITCFVGLCAEQIGLCY